MERWQQAYTEAPEIFDAFCRAEDPDGLIATRLRADADLDGADVLELGCGTGRHTSAWSVGARRWIGVERSVPMLALARAALPQDGPLLICGDARRLPLRDASLDRVVAGWVVINLPPAERAALLDEALRVLRPGGRSGIWLVENHWSGEFQALRGRRPEVEQGRIRALLARGFELVDVVRTRLRFPSADEAARVLGYLCGDAALCRLEERPVETLGHHVVILRRRVRGA